MAVTKGKRRRQPKSDEEREMHLINLAYDYAEKQFLEGTASSQVTTHFLKMGSAKNKLEEEKVRRENLLLEARVEELKSAALVQELYERAIISMTAYQGRTTEDEVDVDE